MAKATPKKAAAQTADNQPDPKSDAPQAEAPKKKASKPKASAKPAINSKGQGEVKAPETAAIVREVRIKLSDTELRKAGDHLADAHQCLAALALEEKTAKQGFKARREKLVQEIEEEGERIREKSELRPVDCIVYFDTPRKGLKTIKRADTLETVAEERMIGPDLERQLL